MSKRYFGTDGIRGRMGDKLINPEFVLKLGWAVGKVLAQQGSGKVLIGKDTRISGYMLESALEAGLSAAGIDIHLLGPMPTPGIAYLTRTLRAQAGIVISASHNLYHDNGIKFFSAEGMKFPDEMEYAIESQIDKLLATVASAKLGKAVRIVDAPGRYIEFCKSTVPGKIKLSGLRIVVDCAHGATYHVAPDIFRELGANVTTIADKPDGLNINLDCGSTRPELLQQTVLEQQADLGIAFDGDGDRVIMVDHQGQVVDGDEIIYMIAKAAVANKRMLGGVVGTVMSNYGLEQALGELNLGFTRTKVGDRNILLELEKRGWLLGGENSGHIIPFDVTTTGDGIVASLQVLAAMFSEGCSLADLRTGIVKFPQSMINVPCMSSGINLDSSKLQSAVREAQAQLQGSGRVLLRPSGTEPVVRVMVEGADYTQVNLIAQDLASMVQEIIN